MDLGLEEPRIKLPEPNDQLYVVKAIDKYEPLINKAPESMIVDDTKLFKPFSSTPSSHSELRDTTKELNGEDL